MMIKPNRGRDWLDWQRKLCSAGKWVGLGALFLMMGTLLFGEMGISRYLHLRDHAEQLDQELAELQRRRRGPGGRPAAPAVEPARPPVTARISAVHVAALPLLEHQQ